MPNQNPEQRARDQIDAQLRAAGWAIQSNDAIDFNEGQGQAVREYPTDLRDCQIAAVTGLDKSVKKAKPRSLVQMATGSGKTFAAITFVYRLLKHARAKRILFLVDTRNLGEQAEQEFLAYTPSDDNRKFTELYTVQRLNSCHVPKDAEVCISTIQRMYSILQGRELDESAEDENPAEHTSSRKREPLPVTYNEKVPIEHFDLIIIDECHRSIYNLWRQVLDYFDAFLVGLTATPDARTYAFFEARWRSWRMYSSWGERVRYIKSDPTLPT